MSSSSTSTSLPVPIGFEAITNPLFLCAGVVVARTPVGIFYSLFPAFLANEENRKDGHDLHDSKQSKVDTAVFHLSKSFICNHPHIVRRGYQGTLGRGVIKIQPSLLFQQGCHRGG
jgi:hypothetical protein